MYPLQRVRLLSTNERLVRKVLTYAATVCPSASWGRKGLIPHCPAASSLQNVKASHTLRPRSSSVLLVQSRPVTLPLQFPFQLSVPTRVLSAPRAPFSASKHAQIACHSKNSPCPHIYSFPRHLLSLCVHPFSTQRSQIRPLPSPASPPSAFFRWQPASQGPR